MNILRLVYEWPPPWDGLAPAPYELTRAQVKLGHDVTVFCGGGFGNLGRVRHPELVSGSDTYQIPNQVRNDGEVADLVTGDHDGLKVYRFPRALKRFSLFLTTSPMVLLGYLFLNLTGRGPDLVHGHGHITLWFSIYKLLFSWLDKTPYVLHLHITAAGREQGLPIDSFPRQAPGPDFWTKYFEWPLHKFSDWLGVRVADRVICVSSRVMEEAVKFYGARVVNLVVVENGVNTDLFFPESYSASRITYNVLYVGALSPRKNSHLLIEAMKFLPEDYYLTIVGRGNKNYEDKLHRLVESLKLQDRVEFEGYVEYPELPSFYRNAAVFVLPSSYEGLPKVVFEALASGVPVLASGFGLARLIDGLEFLKDLEPEAIAERIQRLLDSGVSVDVSRVQELYSWERKAREIEAIYSTVTEGSG